MSDDRPKPTGTPAGPPVLVLDQRLAGVIAPDAELRLLWTGGVWTEGPVYLPADDAVVWSDIPNDRLLRWSAASGTTVELQPANFINGHTLDVEGRVIHCSHGARAVLRSEPDGSLTTLVDRWEGHRLNSPNDVVVKSDGTIWFTDPPYGILSNREGYQAEQEMPGCWVLRFDPATGELYPVVTDMLHPNGLAFSPDESVLYVADTSAAVMGDQGRHHLRAYDLRADGRSVGSGRVFAEISPGLPDGFRVDRDGNLLTSCAEGIQVFAADGTHLGTIAVPEPVSNCCFGGPDRTTLFITATSSMYAIDLLTSDR